MVYNRKSLYNCERLYNRGILYNREALYNRKGLCNCQRLYNRGILYNRERLHNRKRLSNCERLYNRERSCNCERLYDRERLYNCKIAFTPQVSTPSTVWPQQTATNYVSTCKTGTTRRATPSTSKSICARFRNIYHRANASVNILRPEFSFIYSRAHFSSEEGRGTLGLEIPRGQEQPLIDFLPPHQHGTKQSWKCNHSPWSLVDLWTDFPRV